MLKEQYDSVFSMPDTEKAVENLTMFFSTEQSDSGLNNVVFDRNDVINKIDSLSTGAAAGPDGVPAILLKRCKYSLVDALVLLFRKFLKDGKFHDLMKLAFVIPIHKGGSR